MSDGTEIDQLAVSLPQVGQVWRDKDTRFERLVEIVEVRKSSVTIRTVSKRPKPKVRVRRDRFTSAFTHERNS